MKKRRNPKVKLFRQKAKEYHRARRIPERGDRKKGETARMSLATLVIEVGERRDNCIL